MLKLVWKDYFSRKKEAFALVYAEGMFLYIYMMVIPLWNSGFRDAKMQILYYSVFSPVLLGLMISRMYPNKLQTTLLLCPLTEEEKREYVRVGFRLRIALPFLLFVLWNVFFVVTGGLHFVYFLEMTAICFFFLVSVNIYCKPERKSVYAMKRTYKLPGNYEAWNVLVQFVGLLGMLVVVAAIKDEGNVWNFRIALGFLLLVVVEFLIFLRFVFVYYEPVMEQAIRYEESEAVEKR